MFIQLLNKLDNISKNRWYWSFYIVCGALLLLIALYYQHVLDEQPCVVCIQIRLLITLYILVSVFSLIVDINKVGRFFSNVSIVIVSASFVERCYLLLGTERGFIFSDCGFSLGLPSWLAIEDWVPWLYRIETSCGYTPEVVFGITMAELLMVISVSVLFLSSFILIAFLMPNSPKELSGSLPR